jgi:uncharacterized damage-inducible protein DinB
VTTAIAVLTDAFDRIREAVHEVAGDLAPEDLNRRPEHGSNSVSWLVWHLTRVQDDHVADAAGLDQVWMSQGWQERFGLRLPAFDTGYGHVPRDVAAVRVDDAELLTGYHDAVHAQTVRCLAGLKAIDLDRIVDESWTPPVTLAARLMSVVADDLQHVGQAAYVRGMLGRGGLGE